MPHWFSSVYQGSLSSVSNYSAEKFIRPHRSPRHVAIWLLVLCAMIYCVIAIGGYTRLTSSGLSIVNWEPVTGIVPPLSQEQWMAQFERYQQYPEFKEVNADMTLAGFKRIYWVEYVHRIAGRSVALLFLVPFVFFTFRGYLSKALSTRLIVVFILGGLQGVLGWYMVKSGLVNDPSVSQYRLTAHLGLAVILYSYILWLAVGLLSINAGPNLPRQKLFIGIVCVSVFLVALMQVSGGFMAGTHAGFVINTFPDMNGQWIPDMLFLLTPVWHNPFENVVTIQFIHRWAGTATVLVIVVLWIQRFSLVKSNLRMMLDVVMAAALLQFSLGVATLLKQVDIPVAMAHQTGFILLLSVLIILLNLATRGAHDSRESLG